MMFCHILLFMLKNLVMARVITMSGRDLFPDLFPDWAKDDYLGAALREGIPLEWLGVCKGCPLLEVCSSDECGRLGFSVSVNNPKKYGYGKNR